MKIAIVGSREGCDQQVVKTIVGWLPPGTTVISGGADGVDTWAEQAAKACGLTREIFQPNLAEHNGNFHLAALARNREVVIAAHGLIAIWNGKSTGTEGALRTARIYHKPVLVNPRQEKQVLDFLEMLRERQNQTQ